MSKTKEEKQARIIEIDYQVSAASGAIELNNTRIMELVEANQRHAYDIQKINRERSLLEEDLKP